MRTFARLGFHRAPGRAAVYLPVMDTIIAETLRLEREQRMYVFLMNYARATHELAREVCGFGSASFAGRPPPAT